MTITNYEIAEQVVTRPCVNISALAVDVKIKDLMLQVYLKDGRMVAVPLNWFPVICEAAPSQQANIEIQAGGANLHWPETGVTLSVMGLLAGADPCNNCWYRVSYFK
jgi:hypothetical protein